MNIFSIRLPFRKEEEKTPTSTVISVKSVKNEDETSSIQDTADITLNEQPVGEAVVRWCVYLIALLTPLWFLPVADNPVDENKMFFVSILTFIGFITWLGAVIHTGGFRVPKNFILYTLGIWVMVYFLATVFSISPEVSFWGPTVGSFFHFTVAALLAFLASVAFRAPRDIHWAYGLVLVSAAVAVLFLVVQTVWGVDILPWEFAALRTFHPVGSWNTVGIFFGFILSTMIPFFTGKTGVSWTRRIFFAALAICSLLGALLVNYSMVWLSVAIVTVIYLAYTYSQSSRYHARTSSIAGPLLLLFAFVILYLSQDIINVYTISFNPPLEVTPSVSSSWQVAGNVFQERPILGVGPGQFGYAWDRFKDPAANTTIYWRLRFATASSFATTLLATTGILGTLAFLLFVGSLLWFGFSVLRKLQQENVEHQYIHATYLGLLFLIFSWFFYPLTVFTSVFLFLTLGLFLAQVNMAGIAPYHTFPIRADSVKGFIIALVVVFLMVLSVAGLYVRSRKQAAVFEYGRGVEALLERDSVNEAENFFRRAAAFDDSRDQFYNAITQTSAIKIQRTLQETAGRQPEEVQRAFQVALSSAISSAQAATEKNPGNAANWRLLGQVYELVIPYVGGSAEAAAEAYQQAITQAPRDPILRDDLARVLIVLGDHVKARESLEEALRQKPDYAAAHFRLAQIAIIKGNVDDAIGNSERAALSAPNDIGILFQLGLLYYQQNRLRDARLIFERAVQLNTNYSNARYFLGLSYAAQGEYTRAVEQFKYIQQLNPDSAEVKTILANLDAGREPLEGISPPPLMRTSPPVAKEGQELEQKEELENTSPAESGTRKHDTGGRE